jgi:hypothetical protein
MHPLEGVRLDADQQVFADRILKKSLSILQNRLAGVLD